jgi:hypothetical protein
MKQGIKARPIRQASLALQTPASVDTASHRVFGADRGDGGTHARCQQRRQSSRWKWQSASRWFEKSARTKQETANATCLIQPRS